MICINDDITNSEDHRPTVSFCLSETLLSFYFYKLQE